MPKGVGYDSDDQRKQRRKKALSRGIMTPKWEYKGGVIVETTKNPKAKKQAIGFAKNVAKSELRARAWAKKVVKGRKRDKGDFPRKSKQKPG